LSAVVSQRSRIALAIGLLAFVAAAASVSSQLMPNTWLFRDGRFYTNVTTTIAEDLSLEQHRFAASWYSGTLGWNRDLDPGWSNVALGAHGQHWPKHPYVLPLLASPLYFALGLPATLLFNLLMYGVIAAGLFRFARAYADPQAAALASGLFVFASIVVGSAYDYSTDVLMLALFAQGLAAVKDRPGPVAGLAMGACVVIKPTALMLLPSLVLLFFERTAHRGAEPDRAITRRELGWALGGGTVVLALFALANTVMYGRPWWSGYNRTLVTAAGEPTVASHTDAFSVPFEAGLQRVLFGDYGLLGAFGVLAVSVPGLLVLARARPRAALAAVLSVSFSLAVFSRYVYEGHRFHWPALALLVPALALTLSAFTGTLARPLAASARRLRPSSLVATGLAAFAASMFTVIGSGRERLGTGPWADAMLSRVPENVSPEVAPFLVIALHAIAAGVLCAALASLLETPRALSAAAVLVPFGVGEVRRGLQAGGPGLLAVALAVLALAIVVHRARSVGERAAMRSRHAAVAAVLLALAASCALLPHDDAASVSLPLALREAWAAPSEARAVYPFVVSALLGAMVLVTRASADRASTASLALFVAVVVALVLPGLIGASLTTVVALACLACAALAAPGVDALARRIGRGEFDPRRLGRWAAVLVALCLAVGLARRVQARGEPFRIASEEAVRDALVLLTVPGIGEVPCDFLAWEHLSWECATFDRGTHGEAGLAIDEPARISGAAPRTFLLPTGVRGERRRVVWSDVRAGRELALRWAIPDGHGGGGTLVVRVDDRELGRVPLPAGPTGTLRELRYETTDVGETARLELEIEGASRQSVIAIDGVWR